MATDARAEPLGLASALPAEPRCRGSACSSSGSSSSGWPSTSTRRRRTSSASSSIGLTLGLVYGADRPRLLARLRDPRADQLRARRRVHARRDDGGDGRSAATLFDLTQGRGLVRALAVIIARAARRDGVLRPAERDRSSASPTGRLRNAPRLAPLITAIGISFILQNVGLDLEGPATASPSADILPAGIVFAIGGVEYTLGEADRPARDAPGADPASSGSCSGRARARRCARPRRTGTPPR